MTTDNLHDPTIDVPLVRRLIAAQFPRWADLPIAPVPASGWDNRTFRLGAAMTVRLPSAAGYAPQVAKEQRWLPHLAPHLPLPIPTPLAAGAPDADYPWPWSVYGWIPGASAAVAPIADLTALAADLGAFLAALQRIDAAGGPAPGQHSAFRGGPLSFYAAETEQALAAVADLVDAELAAEVWRAALASAWQGPPVWFHGDVAVGNLLVRDGTLAAVIDFGCAGVGDPACDLVIAWTRFAGPSRTAFRAALPLDADTWARGRGWALWKALITLAEPRASNREKADEARQTIAAVIEEYLLTRAKPY